MSGLCGLADLTEEEYLEMRLKEVGTPREEIDRIIQMILSDPDRVRIIWGNQP